jgi:hypothetical protein
MRVIQVKCSQCAAVLKVEPDKEFIDCEYCGTRSTVQRRTRVFQLPRPVVAPVQVATQTPRVALQVVNKARIVVSLFSTLFSFALIAGIFWFVNKQVEKATGKSVIGLARSAAGGGPGRMTWLGHGPALLARLDGDRIPDPVGRVRYVGGGDALHLAAFSGASGERLWQSAALGSYSDTYQGRVIHADPLILFADPRGSLTAYRSADGGVKWTVSLSDKVERACRLDARSIAIQTADQSWQTVSMADGAARRSSGPVGCTRLPDDDEDTGDPALVVMQPGSLKVPGMSVARVVRRGRGPPIAVGSKQPGSAVPMLARLDRSRPVWKVEVPAGNPLAARTSAPEFVSITDSQACAIYEQQDSSPPRLTCFDLASGSRRFDSEIEKGTTIVMEALVWSGQRFYLSSWGHLQVFDDATGQRLHLIGVL